MLEKSYGQTFFLKSPKRKSESFRYVYVRITVDGVARETSTKRKWDARRWDQRLERATGTKEDARSFNFFLDSLVTGINLYKTELINNSIPIIADLIIDHVKGNSHPKAKVLEEFLQHNEEMHALIGIDYAKGTYERYVTARSHVKDFIFYKYKKDDLEFRELNFDFVKDYEFYLKTVRGCSNNTALKYISNFKKIVLLAVAKGIILVDPFKLFKGKKTKGKKKPLTKAELKTIENRKFSTDRLSLVRDIFVFQCYTGLAYIDIRQLRKDQIKEGNDGKMWIMSERQKTDSNTDIPLLPKAREIMEKYKDDPGCLAKGLVFPVKSNQKTNEYLKEIQTLCGIGANLTTHKARRTFASTVTLSNGVPIHIVKEMLGHHSVKQTEDYAITVQEAISSEMIKLEEKLSQEANSKDKSGMLLLLDQFEAELKKLKENPQKLSAESEAGINGLEQKIIELRKLIN